MDEQLNENQEKALSELRFLLKGDIPSTLYKDTQSLKRFLVARDYNAKKAEAMIRKNLIWRKEMQVDHVLTDFQVPEVLLKYFPVTFVGHDKEGTPVTYAELGQIDEKGLLKSVNPYLARKFVVHMIETNLHRFKPDGSGQCDQIFFVFNVAQLAVYRLLNKRILPVVMKIFTEFQDNYPERIKTIFVINTSSTFAAIWAIVKEWLGSSLIRKILICEEGTFEDELRERIDADVLPAFLGGNRTDPDGNPECPMTINRGKIVPAEYFTDIDPSKFLQTPGSTSARIGRQKQLIVPFEVTESNCIINWEFIVLHSYDIGFGLSLNTSDEMLEEVIPVHKIETECLTQTGMHRCKSPGSYFIIFDNTYSWIHAKDICYRIWSTAAD